MDSAAEPPTGFLAALQEQSEECAGWVASLALHLCICMLLWLTVFPVGHREEAFTTLAGWSDSNRNATALESLGVISEPLLELESDALPNQGAATSLAPDGADSDAIVDDLELHTNLESKLQPDAAPADSNNSAPQAQPQAARRKARRGTANANSSSAFETNLAKSLDGRTKEARLALIKSGGGTEASERAVELGLKWLARHQRSDGSWSFQHGPDDPGILDCPMGATGLALLAFLGAGNTHKEGDYIHTVDSGLKYLVGNLEVTKDGGFLRGTGQTTMYVQGIGTIALCEAYALTKDRTLRRPAQQAIDFIVRAQDPAGGGWRYRIPQAGDTSVVGWQIMALKSAKIAGLNVPPRVITKATTFLNSVQSEAGALYGYTRPETVRPATTAVGLLCRMYLGRELRHKGMMQGVKYLTEWGPRPQDMYFSYYATQVMHHWGGTRWQKWNPLMRDGLVASQVQYGEAAGSWMTDRSHHAEMGGRLYTTCLSIMTLEVYYRHLPLYQPEIISTEF